MCTGCGTLALFWGVPGVPKEEAAEVTCAYFPEAPGEEAETARDPHS